MATDMNRHVWEGWTVGMFIDELAPIVAMIMAELAKTVHHEGGTCRMVPRQSAILQETDSGRKQPFRKNVQPQMTMLWE